jgi:hypothetical protein
MTMMRIDTDRASLYQELNEQQDEIQLLRVLPQADNSAIHCILERALRQFRSEVLFSGRFLL